jgi:predicted nucleotidyltransferase
MQREDVIRALRPHLEEFRRDFGVVRLALFGSVARNEAHPGSDIDLLVGFADPPGFDGYMSLKFRIEDLLGCRVDLVMDEALKPFARPAVEREAIRVA